MMNIETISTIKDVVVASLYLVSAVLFILGIKRLAHPKHAPQGNMLGAAGMLVAFITAFIDFGIVVDVESYPFRFESGYWVIILIAVVLGSVVGIVGALKVQMTSMPQMVAIFNGFGGLASLLVAGVYYQLSLVGAALEMTALIATVFSGLIGAVTFTGSFIAFSKLQGLKIIPDKPVTFKGDLAFKLVLLTALIALGIVYVIEPSLALYWAIVLGGFILGFFLVVGIGGADMPVVIALLNAYSGLAAAATGFVLSNTVLIISGSLVGASGIILSAIMCKAMNRSLLNVLFGGFGGVESTLSDNDIYAGKVKSTSSEEVAMILKGAQSVVIVPGYGMAVARASSAVKQLSDALEQDGIAVTFGIHPVAGRMPGHMNVLLAEESIDYDKLLDLESVNPRFSSTDLVLILGANDVVNPLARDPKSPIAGMPILNVDEAGTCVVIKRSLSSGFAGLPNPLFANDNTMMLFSDAKKAVEEMVKAYKDL